MQPPMIEIKHLVKRYGSLLAVNDISFEINRGELFGFLGPNGAGKTTTMKILAGLLQPTAGEVRIDGINQQDAPVETKKRIGYIPDRPFIYEKLTAHEFLLFMAGLYNIPKHDAKQDAERLLSLFGLSAQTHELVENFSHGMKQRLTMASALIHKPRVIIVDEPMVGLDPKGSLLIRKIFRSLCEEEGVTILLSTHTLSIAEEVCDRIGIIYKGQLIALGTLGELHQQAQQEDSGLEEIFLALTEEQEQSTTP